MKTIGLIVFLLVTWPIFAALLLCLSALVCAAAWFAIPFCRFKPSGGGEIEMRPFWVEASKEPE